MSSSNHHDTSGFAPPSTVQELRHQPPSSVNLPDSTTLHLPHTPSLMAPATEPNAPEPPIAASLAGATFTTPSTSFQSTAATTTTAVTTHNPVRRTQTDTNSSANHDPPTITTNFDPIKSDSQEQQKNKTPAPRVSSPTKSKTSPPAARKQTPQSKLRNMEDKVREIKQRFSDIIFQSQEQENENPPQAVVGRTHEDGCFRLNLRCSCGKRKGICRDVVYFLSMIVICCSFFMTGVAYCILLVVSICFK